jgi:hypothetical protein
VSSASKKSYIRWKCECYRWLIYKWADAYIQYPKALSEVDSDINEQYNVILIGTIIYQSCKRNYQDSHSTKAMSDIVMSWDQDSKNQSTTAKSCSLSRNIKFSYMFKWWQARNKEPVFSCSVIWNFNCLHVKYDHPICH